jgi:hypothetical protein
MLYKLKCLKESFDNLSIPENRHLYVAIELAKLVDNTGSFDTRYDSKNAAENTSPHPVDLQYNIIYEWKFDRG